MHRNNREIDKIAGEIIDAKRKQLKITQKDLSKMVGISDVYYRNIIMGQFRPTWVIFVDICAALDIDVNDLINQCVQSLAA